jgi:pimeloyl-ACP methyl ester carboxylesterase
MRTFVLIPGAGGEAWYWHLVVPRLRALGHEAIAIELPTDDESAGLAEYADTVAAAINGHKALSLVAQSMGAFTAPLLCSRFGVREIALVAPMIPAPGESAGEWFAKAGGASDEPFDPIKSFFHDVPQDIVDEAIARGEPRQADKPFGEPWPLDAWPDVPTRMIAGTIDRLFSLDFQRRIARERLGLETDVIESGHLPALARPDELVAWLSSSR